MIEALVNLEKMIAPHMSSIFWICFGMYIFFASGFCIYWFVQMHWERFPELEFPDLRMPLFFKIGMHLPLIVYCLILDFVWLMQGPRLWTLLVCLLVNFFILLLGISTWYVPYREYKKHKLVFDNASRTHLG